MFLRHIQRIGVVLVAMTVGFGVFLVGRDGYQTFFGAQVFDDPTQSALGVSVELLDDFSGLAETQIGLSEAFIEQVEQRVGLLEAEQYPLVLELCVTPLFCESLRVEDAQQKLDLSVWQGLTRDVYLPVEDDLEIFVTLEIVLEGTGERVTFESDLLELPWVPAIDFRDGAGVNISPEESLSAGMMVFLFSRSPQVTVSFDGADLSLQASQTDPSIEPVFYHWAVQIPVDEQDLPQEVCVGFDADLQCHHVSTEPRPAAPEFICGDGERNPGEQCDDGNVENGDGCDALCQREIRSPQCGNGVWDQGEECDDGNLVSGDGCDEVCLQEPNQMPEVASGEFVYPDFKLYFNELSEELVFLFASLDQLPSEGRVPDAEDLFIRLKTDIPGGIVPQDSRRENGLPILQTILPKGTQVILEFVHRISRNEEVVFARQFVDTFEPEQITRGEPQGEESPHLPEVQQIVDRAVVVENGLAVVSEDIRVQLPSQRFTNESLTINGVSEGSSIKVCLVNLLSGAIRDGKTITVRDNGTFYDRLTDEVLDPGKYAALMYSDTQLPCDQLVNDFVGQADASQQPIILEVVDSALNISVLDVSWLSNDEMAYDEVTGQLFDLNPESRDAVIALELYSSFQEDLEVVVSFVDDLIDYEQTLNGYARDQVLLDFEELAYGSHRLRIYAILPNGQKTADILVDLNYLPVRMAAGSPSSRSYWGAIVLLLILGTLYLYARYRMRSHLRSESDQLS